MAKEEIVKENRMNVKLGIEKKFNVAQWEYETYKIELEGPYDGMMEAKDMVRLLLPVVRNMRTVTVKAYKGERPDDNVTIVNSNAQEVEKKEENKGGNEL
jgi:hypothetical protein